LWSNGQSTQDLTGLTAGTYSVTITDLNGCTKNHSVTISQPNAALTLSTTQVNVLCFGNTTGSIDVSVSGGTPGYTYNWSNGLNSQDINSLNAGNYTLITTDSKGCSAQLSFVVTQPASPLISSIVENNIACFSDATGSINLNVFGGTFPYSFSWNNGSLTEDLTGLTSGQYIVTITDINGCILKDTANLSQPIAPLAAQITKVDATCFGSSDGSINLSINGGTSPYSFIWSNGSITEDLTNLTAGNYQVQVTDLNGCSLSANTTINQPLQIAVTSSNNDVLCFGESTGSIILSLNGGITPYQFSWSNGSTLQDLNNVSAGNYSVIITDSNNCTQSFSTTIIEPLTTINLSISHTDALCIGGQQGTTDLSVSGGNPPYSFLWNNNQISEDLSNLVAGYYYCTVTDNHGCSDTIGATIFDPSNTMEPSISKANVSCFGGSDGAADLSIIGGLPPYEYSWSSGSVSQDLSNLQIGNYFVTITDVNSCQSFISTFVDQPNAPLSSVESLTDVKCFGNSTGAIDVTINGGTPPYSYSWSNGLITEDLSEIAAGVYQLIVTDFNYCQLTINNVIFEPTDLILSALTENVKCYGGSDGSIDLTVSGGVSPYSYSYSNGSVFQDLNNLLFGNYKVIVSDNNLCKDSLSILVSQPSSPLQVDELLSHVSCFSGNDGSIDITISGGTNPYSVSWNNGSGEQDQVNLSSGNYTLDITDDNGCFLSENFTLNQPAAPLSTQMSMTENLCFGDSTGTASVLVFGGTPGYSYSWESGQTTSQITGLHSGIYIVEVKDSKNCLLRDTIEVSQPTKLSVNADSLSVSCWGVSDGGTISFIQGGVGSYSFNWLPINNNNQNVSNLPAGIYTIQVNDQNNCFATDSTEVLQPDSLFATFELTDILCHGEPTGAIDATLFGGTAPFSCFCINNLSGIDTAGLTAGFYQYVVVDDNGCSVSSTLELTEPSPISALSQMIPVNCFGGNDGSLNMNVTGGIDPYLFLWSIGDTTANIDSLYSGNYVLQVKDSNNCISSFTFSVTEPTFPLTSTFVAVQPQCFGYGNGQLLITTSGGTPGYNYLWSTGDTTQNLDSLFTGNYSVILTDTNNCKDTLDCFLAEPAQLQPSFDADILVGCSPLIVNFSNTSNASYNCEWTFGNEGNFNGCEGVTYQFEAGGIFDVSLTVYDSNGCFNDITYENFITVYQSPVAAINANPQVLYPEQNTTFISNNSLHGDFYIWNMGDGTSNELLFEPGTYTYPMSFADSFLITLYAMTTEGCSDTAYQKIFFRNDPYYYVPNTFTVNDDLMNDSWSPVFSNPYGVKKYLMQIFNRWGELIFETNDVFLGWTGVMNNQQVQDGTYSWRMQFTWVDNRVYSEVGHVNLLR
jgi:gliding motility-associated-like protein